MRSNHSCSLLGYVLGRHSWSIWPQSFDRNRLVVLVTVTAHIMMLVLRITKMASHACQGGFQSSWTGRNGGASGDTSSQSVQGVGNRNPRAPSTAGRRFGTVSNPSIANGQAASTNDNAVVSRQRETLPTESTGLGSEEGSSSGIASQVTARS